MTFLIFNPLFYLFYPMLDFQGIFFDSHLFFLPNSSVIAYILLFVYNVIICKLVN
jgi:hypothetical protein